MPGPLTNRFGQQKPRQFGLLSDVEVSVRRNADQMHVNHDNLAFLCPFWSNTLGFHNIMSGGVNTVGGTPDIISGGIHLDSEEQLEWTDKNYVRTPVGSPVGSSFHVGRLTSSPDTNDRNIMRMGASDSYGLAVKGISGNDAAYQFRYSTTYKTGPTITDLVGKVEYIGANYPGDWATGAIYRNGKLYYSPTTGGTFATTTPFLRIGYHSTSYGAYQDMFLLALWNEYELSAAEHAIFADVPYFLLQPNPAPVYFDLAIGSPTGDAIVTSTASVTSIGSKASTDDATITSTASVTSVGSKVPDVPTGDATVSATASAVAAGSKSSTDDAAVSATASVTSVGGKSSTDDAAVSATAEAVAIGNKSSTDDTTVTATASVTSAGSKASTDDATVTATASVTSVGRNPETTTDFLNVDLSLQVAEFSFTLKTAQIKLSM